MSEFNIGRKIVEHVLQEGDLRPFLDAGFVSAWAHDGKDITRLAVFSTQNDLAAYQFILRHWEEHGAVADVTLFHARCFPEGMYEVHPSGYAAGELVTVAQEAAKQALVRDLMWDLNESVEREDYDSALARLDDAGKRLRLPLADLSNEMGVQAALRKMRQQREAKRRLEASDDWEPPVGLTGPEIAALETSFSWRVEGILNVGGDMMLNAAFKSGKSTLMLNLIRCLLSGEPFLGEFKVDPVASVWLMDLEMPLATGKLWLGRLGLLAREELRCSFLTGRARSLSVLNDNHRAALADRLRGTEVLIIDPLGPLLAALGLDENDNSDVRTLLNGLDTLKAEAGISELIVVHHAGHAATRRARGSSVLSDWPDMSLNLRNDQPDNPLGARTLSGLGREMFLADTPLKFDAETKLLTTWGKAFTAQEAHLSDRIITVLRAIGRPVTKRELLREVTGNTAQILSALESLRDGGIIEITQDGKAHYVSLVPPA